MIKGSIHQEDITIINIYGPNIRALKYNKEILRSLKGKIDNNTTVVEDFNTPLSAMDRSSTQKINEETLDLNHTLDQMDFTGIYRTCYQTTVEYTFFSSAMEHS